MASRKNLLMGVLLILGTACDGYLDVKPKGHYLQERVFSDVSTIELAQRGLYTALSANELYGGTLTMAALDVLGQYYQYPESQLGHDNVFRSHIMFGMGNYDYTDSYVANTFTATWTAAYRVILNINSFIAGLKKSHGILSEAEYNLYLGEAYGLRAYVHFDLLRLFGPVYSEEPDGLGIPYHVVPTPRVQPVLPAAAVAKLVLSDLDSAASCLTLDPLREATAGSGGAGRFNYYAVMALYARVYLYLGAREQAARYATIVLEENKGIFGLSADGTLDGEVIFGLTVAQLDAQYRRYFAPTLRQDLLLSPVFDVLAAIYGGNLMDLRYRNNWKYYPYEGQRIDAFQKYAPPATVVPMLRLSELYFIMAECAANDNLAFEYLRQVAQSRNETKPDAIPLGDALQSAYKREFWGEGQLFFYYKRIFMKEIPSGSGSGQVIAMDKEKYQVPLPKGEMMYR